MTIENRVLNGGFETGAFSPWVASNATITSQFSHSGFFAARLLGGNVNSFIFQYIEANPSERFEFLVSLAKVGPLTSPPVSLSVAYYNASFGFLGYGLITNIPSGHIPSVEDETWLEVYETTSPAPPGTTQALVLINKLPQAGSADVIVDDVALLTIEGGAEGCLCDCCVFPMQNVLQQLVGETVILGTIADEPNVPPLFFLFDIISVNDFLVTVTDGMTTFVVNISDVTGVGFQLPGPTINLLPPVDSGCECDCRERPIRQFLDTLIGSTVNLLAVNGSIATDFNVEQTGLGIVLGTLPISPDTTVRFAISTCKIVAVNPPPATT